MEREPCIGLDRVLIETGRYIDCLLLRIAFVLRLHNDSIPHDFALNK